MVRIKGHIALFVSLLPAMAFAQDSISYLSGNVKAWSKSDGMFFANGTDAGFEAPVASGNFAVKNAGLWFSASDASNTIRVAAHAFDRSGTDFTAGPLSPSGGMAADPASWNKVYKMSSQLIAGHREHFRDESYVPDAGILQWPGNGSGTFSKILAPFVDYADNNLLYEPAKGDYPYIAGNEAVYSISNDAYSVHSYSKAPALGIEVQSLLYRFDTEDTVLRNTVLARVVVHNRSTRNYGNFCMSLFTNHILGNANDNFLSTDVKHNAVICYNGNDSDAVYGKNPPAFASILLNKKLSSSMYILDNSGQINSKPVSPAEFRNYMSGKWRNGKQLVYGGQGIDNGSPARYIYPDDQDPAFAGTPWTEDLVGNTPGYRISLMNTDSAPFNAGSVLVYELAFVFVDKKADNLKQVRAQVAKVTEAYQRGALTSVDKTGIENNLKWELFPNPVSPGNTMFFDGFEGEAQAVEFFDGNMRLVMNKKLFQNEKSIILDKNLENGLYFVRLKTTQNAYFKRILLQSN